MLRKIIGTFVPLSALYGQEQMPEDHGTFASGTIFLDWLKKTHQSAWQMLPLYETQLEPGSKHTHVSSPYKSYGIGLDPKYIPENFKTVVPTEKEKRIFLHKHMAWILDYALFCSLRDHFQTDDWRVWDADIQKREEKAIMYWKERLKEKVNMYVHEQWRAHASYTILKKKAKQLQITLIGDVPFYLSIQSPLVWMHQEVFQIEKNGEIPFVSGIPNSSSAHFGRQVWGHPLYNWDAKNHRTAIISFWKMRFHYLAVLFDSARFDHAKGLFQYGVMDTHHNKNDMYRKGPGADVFEELIHYCQHIGLSIFAEDSGESLHELRASLQKLHIPGIKIFRFALEEKKEKVNSEYANITSYPENTVAYTTTHDTETLVGYVHILTPKQKKTLATVTNVSYIQNTKEFAARLRNAILASPARMVIIPIQDWFLLTDRINIPGTEVPANDLNWHFFLKIPIEDFPAI